jgi:uncharacterized protein YxjI
MKFQVKEKLFAIGSDFEIKDSEGDHAYLFDGHALSWPKKTRIYDQNKICVGEILEDAFAIKEKFRLKVDGKLKARVIKNWTILRKEFILRIPGEDDIMVTGSFITHNYKFTRGRKEIARVGKDILGLSDRYSIYIEDEAYALAVLTTVIAIDNTLYVAKKSHGFVTS